MENFEMFLGNFQKKSENDSIKVETQTDERPEKPPKFYYGVLLCDKPFLNKYNFGKKKVLADKTFKCEYCEKAFTTDQKLRDGRQYEIAAMLLVLSPFL